MFTKPYYSKSLSNKAFTIVEILVFLAIVAIGLTASFQLYVQTRLSDRVAEERRLASMAAMAKIDEIRVFVQGAKTLDQAFVQYGPLPVPTGGPGATFAVPGLTAFLDTDSSDGQRPNLRAIGTVTIINDEAPNERFFGYDYANQCALPPFGVDIDGNGSHLIETGFGPNGAAGYNDQTPYPFPLDLNGNDSDGSAEHPWESNVVTGFIVLPVVITVQWQGAAGPQRYDVFTLIAPAQVAEVAP
jgi:type II secretory pathway pseudopilin PulG